MKEASDSDGSEYNKISSIKLRFSVHSVMKQESIAG